MTDQEPALNIRASMAGVNEIVTEEDSGEAYYTRHYEHFEWPQGASGPTVGIGYDCGYVTADQIRKDWGAWSMTQRSTRLCARPD
jgi:hypothetical protein